MQEIKLDLKEGETVFRTGEAPEIFQYRGYSYRAYTTDSFCRLLKYGAEDAKRAVVFETKKGFRAVVDCAVHDRPQDRVLYDFALSVRAEEWKEIFEAGRAFSVKQMVDFLKRREPDEIEDADAFMAAAKNVKYVIRTEADFSRDDDHNYVVAIRVGEAEGTIRVPECVYVRIPLLEGSDFVQRVEVEVTIHRPKDEKDGAPGFFLSCPKYARYFEKAREAEIVRLESALDGFLVVQGEG
jgi:hypothetical protein